MITLGAPCCFVALHPGVVRFDSRRWWTVVPLIHRSARIPASFRHGFYPDTDPVFSVFHPAERLNMIPSSAPPFFQIHKSHGIGYGMNSVGTAAIKKLGVICGGRGKTRFIRFGGLCPFLWEQPSADRVNTTLSFPL